MGKKNRQAIKQRISQKRKAKQSKPRGRKKQQVVDTSQAQVVSIIPGDRVPVDQDKPKPEQVVASLISTVLGSAARRKREERANGQEQS